MNITTYKDNTDGKKLYYGKISLKKEYMVANADEYGYYFLGSNSAYTIINIVHPDDKDTLIDAFERLHEGIQYLIIRMRNAEDRYVWLYMSCQLNGRVLDGFESIDIRFNDIMQLQDKYDQYVHDVDKYRHLLGLSSQVFYEYEYKTDVLKIYRYRGTRNVMLFSDKLNDISARISNSDIAAEDKNGFDMFVDCIRKGADEFSLKLNGVIFDTEALKSGYDVKGGTIYNEDVRYLSVGVMKSTSRAKKEEAYYLTEAARDSGTGLLNKRAISEYTMERINEGNKSLYLAIMDIDDFKKVNDTYGHMFGDRVLSKVSEIIRSVVGQRGAVGRFGGDEFFILFEGLEGEADLRRILRIINKHIQWAYNGIIKDFTVTTSIGISKFPDDGTAYDELFKKADKSLYIAKAKGKNRYIIYDEEKHGQVDTSGDGERLLGLGSVLSNEKKLSMVSEIILKLHEQGIKALDESLSKIQEYFDIDGIAIYKGSDWKRVHSIGKYIGAIEKFPLRNDSYDTNFDENGVFCENNINSLKGRYNDAYEALSGQETTGIVQIKLEDGESGGVMISFDIFNRSHKRSDADKNYLTIVGKLICELMLNV